MSLRDMASLRDTASLSAASILADNQAPGRLAGIEASRGIAASLVILYHVARHLDKTSGAPQSSPHFYPMIPIG